MVFVLDCKTLCDKAKAIMQSDACGIMPLWTVKQWSKEVHTKIHVLCLSTIHAQSQPIGGTVLTHDE